MRRFTLTQPPALIAVAAALALALAVAAPPAAATPPAAQPAPTQPAPTQPAPTQPAPTQPAQVTGEIVSGDAYSLTVQTPGRAVGVLNALTTAANRLQSQNYPYVWGGGHREAGIASVGEAGGPGYNGKRRGYDCSGSVAAVLAGGGLWPTGASVPSDAGVISYLLHAGVIARGAGTGAHQVTLYDDPGVHIFMSINGRFFGTSDGGGGGDAHGGPGWLDAGPDVTSGAFRRYHVLPRALAATTSAGYTIGFEFGAGLGLGLLDYPTGSKVAVTYRTTASGMLVAEAVTAVGEQTTTGVVQSIAQDGTALTLATPAGAQTTFDVVPNSGLAEQLATGQVVSGDTVSAGYLDTAPATLTLIALSVTSVAPTTTEPAPPPATTTVTATTPTTTSPTTQAQTAPAPQTDANGSGGSGW